jgi:hypothetical protein
VSLHRNRGFKTVGILLGGVALLTFLAHSAYQVFYVNPAATYLGGVTKMLRWHVATLILVACLVVALLAGAAHWAWTHLYWRRFQRRAESAERRGQGRQG